MNPTCANCCSAAVAEKVYVVPSICGPGYTCAMIGYFLCGSKSNGFHMFPYKSVTPSAAFTTNVSGIFQPTACNCDRSDFSSSSISRPLASLRYEHGCPSTRLQLSTTYDLV